MGNNPKKLTFNQREWDRTFQMISWWDVESVRNAKVLVVGAGAIGNEVLKNLALLNVGNILIADFDTIEYSNLCRSVLFRESDIGSYKADVAAQKVRELNPKINVQTIKGDIMLDVGLGVFKSMDVVIGCLDNRLARLFINRHCHKVNKMWVDGAIENLAGQLCVYKPGDSCYECQLSDADWGNINAKLGCADVARRSSSQGRIPTTPISSSIIAAMMVQEALKVIHANDKHLSAGQKYYYEGLNNVSIWFPFGELKDDCQSHFLYDPIIEMPEFRAESSIANIFNVLGEKFEDSEIRIELDFELILEITTKKSEKTHSLIIPQPHLSEEIMRKYQEIPGEDILITDGTHVIDKNFPKMEMTLSEIGIPKFDIIRVLVDDEYHYFELTGDKDFLQFNT